MCALLPLTLVLLVEGLFRIGRQVVFVFMLILAFALSRLLAQGIIDGVLTAREIRIAACHDKQLAGLNWKRERE